jgi:pimeloyl-ACP methyl ester carboxylesterase
MNTNDLMTSWATLPFEEIEARLGAGTDEETASQLFGATEVAEMRDLIAQPAARGLREAAVLIPGVMGSLLSSIRGVTTLTWINPQLFLKGQSSYLELSHDGTSDLHPEIDTVPLALEKLIYTKIALALRRQVDLYEFPYDWRRPIEWNGDLLHTSIERWAAGDPGQQFTLVGHSMGGLVSRAYLARHRQAAEQRIKRVIMHGTPHFGAAGAVEGMIVGNRMLDIAAKLNKDNVTQRLLWNMPSVYQILPAPPALFPAQRSHPANWDLYDAAAWHLEGIRQDYLNLARQFHELLAGAGASVPLVEIAGCNGDTLVEIRRRFGHDEKPEYEMIRNDRGTDAGDATVPLWSAVLPGASMYYVEEVHRYLPRNKQVIEATLELIHGGAPDLPTKLPPAAKELAPVVELEPVDVAAERLRQRLEQGTATEEDLAQLYFAL